MTRLVITGWGAVSAAGVGVAALRDVLGGRPVAPMRSSADPGSPDGYGCRDFDVRALLGRKGTSFMDRATALATVACGLAIADSGLVVDPDGEGRIGLALGTTLGSFASSSDYSRETLVQDRPYLVNPVLFPNTVMNCAAGQAAIRFGLKGVNSTVAGGRIGFLAALRYAANMLRRGYADTMLVGAVEELTPHTAWTHRRLGRRGLPGEAAVVFVLRATPDASSDGTSHGAPSGDLAYAVAGRQPLAEIAAVTSGFAPARDRVAGCGAALAGCVERALAQAGRTAADVRMLATGEVSDPGAEDVERDAVARAFGGAQPRRIAVRDRLGDCGAALGALHLGALLVAWSPGFEAGAPMRSSTCDGEVGVLAGWSPEGSVATAVVSGLGGAAAHPGEEADRVGADRR